MDLGLAASRDAVDIYAILGVAAPRQGKRQMRPARAIAATILALSLLNGGPSDADPLGPPPEGRSEKMLVFGDTEITSMIEGYGATLKVVHKGEMKALLQGVFFSHIIASPDEKFFVGLSNGGLPGSAVAVFTSEDRFPVIAYHGAADFDYCDRTVTLVRHWYDKEEPDVRFVTDDNGTLQAITLRDCRGRTVDLMDTVAEAYSRARQRRLGLSGPAAVPEHIDDREGRS